MPLAVLASSNFTDPEHERLIWLAVGGLVLLGVVLSVATVIWWRGTKGEHAALAPLEVMGDRTFTSLTHVEQNRRLEAVRLHLDGDVEPGPVAADAVDLDAALRAFQPGFDDLRDEDAGLLPSTDPAGPSVAATAGSPSPTASRLAVEVVGVGAPAQGDADGPVATGEVAAVEPVGADAAAATGQTADEPAASAPAAATDGAPAVAATPSPVEAGDALQSVDDEPEPLAGSAQADDAGHDLQVVRNGHGARTVDPMLTGEPVDG
jgi:hypothetical protein